VAGTIVGVGFRGWGGRNVSNILSGRSIPIEMPSDLNRDL
jgi:hypothetical protein